jgi:hypothetical protein
MSVILTNVWEEWTEIGAGFVVAYFAVFVVEIVQHLAHKGATEKAVDRMTDRWINLPH